VFGCGIFFAAALRSSPRRTQNEEGTDACSHSISRRLRGPCTASAARVRVNLRRAYDVPSATYKVTCASAAHQSSFNQSLHSAPRHCDETPLGVENGDSVQEQRTNQGRERRERRKEVTLSQSVSHHHSPSTMDCGLWLGLVAGWLAVRSFVRSPTHSLIVQVE